MKKHFFEYSDSSFALRLFLLNLFLFLFLFLLMLIFKIIFILNISISLGISILNFYLNSKKIKKNGYAIINKSDVELCLDKSLVNISIFDIKNYTLSFNQSIVLIIEFKNRKRIGIVSNSFFCDTTKFELFCRDFQNEVEIIKYNENIEAKRKKSFFEQKWILPLLIILSSSLLILLIVSLFLELDLLMSFFIAISPLVTLWIGYLKERKRK